MPHSHNNYFKASISLLLDEGNEFEYFLKGWCVIGNLFLHLTIHDKLTNSMNFLGRKIRERHEAHKLLLLKVAEYLIVDMAILSRVELGVRYLTRSHVVKLAHLFNTRGEELISLWL